MAEIAGLKLIVPTSASASGGASATISATGKVTFTGVNSTDTISIENCFTSAYDNYLWVIRLWDGGGEALIARLRVSSSDASGTNYTYQRIDANNTSVTGSRSTSQTSMRIAQTGGGSLRNGSHVYIYGPYLAQPTAFRNVSVFDNSSARIIDYAGTHSLSTSYTSMTLLTEGATDMQGTIQIYGLAQ
jgi:hypothetical protein